MQIAIPIYPNFTALDAVGPYEVLVRLLGSEVVFCGAERGPVRTDTRKLGLEVDATFAEVSAPDVIVVPGGPASRAEAAQHGAVVEWIESVHSGTTWTTSVCTGSLLLAAADVLDGLDATTHWAAADDLRDFGVNYIPERVVERGKVITAAGVSSGIDMALILVARLESDDYARAIQLGIEYDPQPPFDAGSPEKAGPELVELVRTVNLNRAEAAAG